MMKPHNFSIEFFPPKTAEGVQKLRATRAQLAPLQPRYYSVTFGAGGSTQQGTLDAVLEIRAEGQLAAPHLSCVGSTRAQLREILQRYRDNGIDRLVALRGDPRRNRFAFPYRSGRISGNASAGAQSAG